MHDERGEHLIRLCAGRQGMRQVVRVEQHANEEKQDELREDDEAAQHQPASGLLR